MIVDIIFGFSVINAFLAVTLITTGCTELGAFENYSPPGIWCGVTLLLSSSLGMTMVLHVSRKIGVLFLFSSLLAALVLYWLSAAEYQAKVYWMEYSEQVKLSNCITVDLHCACSQFKVMDGHKVRACELVELGVIVSNLTYILGFAGAILSLGSFLMSVLHFLLWSLSKKIIRSDVMSNTLSLDALRSQRSMSVHKEQGNPRKEMKTKP